MMVFKRCLRLGSLLGRVFRCARPSNSVASFLVKQSKDRLGGLVGLGEHCRAGLLQDVVAGELGALRGYVHVDDPAVGGFEVGLVYSQHVG